MRALVIFDPAKQTERIAKSVVKGLSEVGFDVETLEANERQGGRIPLSNYDLVCVGSAVTSFFGGQLTAEIDATLRHTSHLEGKSVAVFVVPRIFGTGKALKRLMGLLERQGALVQDFASLRSLQEATSFGRRLKALADVK